MTTYSGDGLTALVGPVIVMLIDRDPASELVHAVWPAVAGGDAAAVLDGLLSRGVSGLPDFGLAAWSGARVSVWRRGEVAVTVYQGDTPIPVPAGSTTFAEHVYEGVDR